jgi:hypothetical protein
MICQAYEYERNRPGRADTGAPLDLSQFFDSVRGRFKTPLVSAWGEEVFRRYTALRSQTGKDPVEVAAVAETRSRFHSFSQWLPIAAVAAVAFAAGVALGRGGRSR